MKAEIWKPIQGADKYFVSDQGRVKHGELILKGRNNGYGYLQVVIRGSEKQVQRLVAEAFKGIIPARWQINHVDKNTLNNSAENLQITTPTENVRHAKQPEWQRDQLKLTEMWAGMRSTAHLPEAL
jgi:hypothetical protein